MAGQLPQDISWGPLVFEARRFVELRKKTFSGTRMVLSVRKLLLCGLNCPPVRRAALPAALLFRRSSLETHISGTPVVVSTAPHKPIAPRMWLTLPFAEQFWSTEAMGMGIFYTLNVFIMQFYLGACLAVGVYALQGLPPPALLFCLP